MTCKPCAARRKALASRKKQKQAEGKSVQAAAIRAVLVMTEVAGKALGIHGEVEDGGGTKQDDGSVPAESGAEH